MSARTRRVGSGRLQEHVAAVLGDAGLADDDANLTADSLVQADIWGHSSHGVMRLPWYLARIEAGTMHPASRPTVDVDAGALASLDAGDGVGQVTATFAMQVALARARAHGIGVVSVRNSNHFGTAMYYTRMATRAGCIGFVATNASPSMAAWGGSKRVLGNNPWSLGAPVRDGPPMLLDMANTAVARGKIHAARVKGESIPPTWALDANGEPTTDPQAAIDGLLQPMGGHKGYGISVMMDVLSGVLGGAGVGAEVTGPYVAEARSRCGHFMWALDIARLQPLDTFLDRMDAMVERLRRSGGDRRVYYPGEPEAEREAAAEGWVELPGRVAEAIGL